MVLNAITFDLHHDRLKPSGLVGWRPPPLLHLSSMRQSLQKMGVQLKSEGSIRDETSVAQFVRANHDNLDSRKQNVRTTLVRSELTGGAVT